MELSARNIVIATLAAAVAALGWKSWKLQEEIDAIPRVAIINWDDLMNVGNYTGGIEEMKLVSDGTRQAVRRFTDAGMIVLDQKAVLGAPGRMLVGKSDIIDFLRATGQIADPKAPRQEGAAASVLSGGK